MKTLLYVLMLSALFLCGCASTDTDKGDDGYKPWWAYDGRSILPVSNK